jgi:sugar fermentation stimulation protein A
MRLFAPLSTGRLLGRRKRFFADIALDDGRTIVAHCPNTGRMLGCLEPGAEVVVHGRSGAQRKLPWTWVLVRAEGSWVAVESSTAVAGVREAWEQGRLPEFVGPAWAHGEVAYGRDGRSRIDLVLADVPRAALLGAVNGASRSGSTGPPTTPPTTPPIWVEVKATTWIRVESGRRVAAVPDAVTSRGTKQLEDLVGCVEAGARAAVVFAVMRDDAACFTPGDAIDPVYGRALRDAARRGVELVALGATIEVHGDDPHAPASIDWALARRLPIEL